MPSITQLPAALTLKGIQGAPFRISFDVKVKEKTGSPVDWATVTNAKIEIYHQGVLVTSSYIPPITSPSTTKWTIDFTNAMTEGIGASVGTACTWVFFATIKALGPYPLLAGSITFGTPTTTGNSASSSANLTVVLGEDSVTLTVVLGGTHGGGSSAFFPPYLPTSYYPLARHGTNVTTPAPVTAGEGFLIPFVVQKTFPAKSIVAVSDQGYLQIHGTAKLAVYADNGSCKPGALLHDYGLATKRWPVWYKTLSTTTFAPGLYWLTAACSVVTPTHPFVFQRTMGTDKGIMGLSYCGYTFTGVSGSFPATASSLTGLALVPLATGSAIVVLQAA